MRSLCLRWMSEVAMKVWIRADSAPLTACAARSMSLSLQRASPATVTPLTRLAIARTASKSPGDAAGKSRLDDVDAQLHQCVGDFQLFVGGQRRAGRLLAVAQRGVEDDDLRRLFAVARTSSSGIAQSPVWPATATGRPFFSQGIISRSSAPTCSTWLPCALVAHAQESLAARFVLGDPLLGKRAVLDAASSPCIVSLHVIVDHLAARRSSRRTRRCR